MPLLVFSWHGRPPSICWLLRGLRGGKRGRKGVPLVYTRQQQLLLAMGYFEAAATLRCARSSSSPAPPKAAQQIHPISARSACQMGGGSLNGIFTGAQGTEGRHDTNADHREGVESIPQVG